MNIDDDSTFVINWEESGKKKELEFKRDETVLRWLTVKLDKFATEYAVRRRNRLSETKKSAE